MFHVSINALLTQQTKWFTSQRTETSTGESKLNRRIHHIGRILTVGMFVVGAAHGFTDELSEGAKDVPPVVVVDDATASVLQPGIDGYYATHDLMRDGRQEEAIERGSETIAFLRSVADETDDPAVFRGANYYLAHTYLDIIVDMNTWMRFNGEYQKVRSSLSKFDGEADYRFVEGKRCALYPANAGGDAEKALDLFRGLGERYELDYYRAVALMKLDDIEGAIEVLESVKSPLPVEEALLSRLLVERREPRITSVTFPDGLRTRTSLLHRAFHANHESRVAVGETLTSERAAQSLSGVESLPSIASAEIEYDFDAHRNEVGVAVNVREGKQRTAGVIAYGAYVPEREGLSPDGDLSSAVPLLLYSDQNLFGRLVQLEAMTAGIFWQIGVGIPSVFGSPFSLKTGLSSIVLPLGQLEFTDAAGERVANFAVDHGQQSASIGTDIALGPIIAGVEYSTGFSVYDEDSIDSDIDVPRDVRHTLAAKLGLDTRSDLFFGASREGVALSLEGAFTSFSGFETWGTEGFRNEAPDGPGTWTYGIAADVGRRIGRRGDVGIEAGAYSGTDFYTRSSYVLGSAMPGTDSALWIRGYPTPVRVESAAIAHARAGYEIVPGTIHAGVYHDIAAVDVPKWIPDSNGLMSASGAALSFALPWSIQLRVSYTHSYFSLDGDAAGGRDVVELTMMRISAF